jgi:hypothetical protein
MSVSILTICFVVCYAVRFSGAKPSVLHLSDVELWCKFIAPIVVVSR